MFVTESQEKEYREFMAQHPEPTRPEPPGLLIVPTGVIPHNKGVANVAYFDRFDENDQKYRLSVEIEETSHLVTLTPEAAQQMRDTLSMLIEKQAEADAAYAQYQKAMAVYQQQRTEWESANRPALDELVHSFDPDATKPSDKPPFRYPKPKP